MADARVFGTDGVEDAVGNGGAVSLASALSPRGIGGEEAERMVEVS